MTVEATRATKDSRRLDALLSAQVAGILLSAERVGKTRFRVQINESTGLELSGVQVDAFLLGVRVGQVSADKPFARTT